MMFNKQQHATRISQTLLILIIVVSLPWSIIIYALTESGNVSSTFYVTKADDTNDGNCNADCSLREAIIAANDSMDDSKIIMPSDTYTLTISGWNEDDSLTGDLDILADLTIEVVGEENAVISGSLSNWDDRLLHIVGYGVNVTVSDITLQNGNAPDSASGGGLRNFANLTLSNCEIVNNYAGEGAGIHNAPDAKLFISNCLIDSNRASVVGGGISNQGQLTVNRTTISNNQLFSSDFYGGGLFNNEGNVTISYSLVYGNTSNGSGGGIASYHSFFENSGTVSILNSTISSNAAGRYGGGIYFVRDRLDWPLDLYDDSTTLNLHNVTLADNFASMNGGGIYHNYLHLPVTSTLNIQNSILSNNIRNGGLPSDCNGTLTSQGFNLIQDGIGCVIVGVNEGNQIGFDANLGPLQDNGGHTFTYSLMEGSPAIDMGNPTGCKDHIDNILVSDQRDFWRFVDGNDDGIIRCDVGAYEFDSSVPNRVFFPHVHNE